MPLTPRSTMTTQCQVHSRYCCKWKSPNPHELVETGKGPLWCRSYRLLCGMPRALKEQGSWLKTLRRVPCIWHVFLSLSAPRWAFSGNQTAQPPWGDAASLVLFHRLHLHQGHHWKCTPWHVRTMISSCENSRMLIKGDAGWICTRAKKGTDPGSLEGELALGVNW